MCSKYFVNPSEQIYNFLRGYCLIMLHYFVVSTQYFVMHAIIQFPLFHNVSLHPKHDQMYASAISQQVKCVLNISLWKTERVRFECSNRCVNYGKNEIFSILFSVHSQLFNWILIQPWRSKNLRFCYVSSLIEAFVQKFNSIPRENPLQSSAFFS